MFGHQQFDRSLDRLTVDVELAGRDHCLSGIGTDVRLFAREEFCVHGQAVFEIIDAQFRGLAEADGAQVARDLDVVFVRGFNHGLQLFARDEVIDFVRSHALGRPVVDGAASIVWSVQRVDLDQRKPLAFQIWARDVELGAGRFAGRDVLFYFEIGVRLHASSRTDGGDSRSQIESRKAEWHVVIEPATRRIKEMVVHTD